jgi:hypothetical protein
MAKQSNSGTDSTDPRTYAIDSITPNFNTEKPARPPKPAANPLADAEAKAENTEPEGDNPSLAESQPLSNNFSFTGTGNQNGKKTNLKGLVKKGGPIILLGGLLGVVAIIMFTGQSSLPFALLSRSDQEFNVNSAVSHNRATTLFRQTLAGDSNPALNGSVYDSANFHLGQRQTAKLIEAGFSFNAREVNGHRFQTITFGGTEYFANEELLNNYTSGTTAKSTANYKVFDPSNPDDFEMGTAFNYATLTWRGKMANAFNHGVAQTLQRLGLDDRNRWNDQSMQKVTNSLSQTDTPQTVILETITNGTANKGTVSNIQSDLNIQVEYPDGSLGIERRISNNTFPTEGAVRTAAEKSARASKAKSTLKEFAATQVSASFSSMPCAANAIGSAFSALVVANQNLSGNNLALATLNIFSQIMSGISINDNVNAAHHDTLIGMTTPGGNGKSMIESSPMISLLGAGSPNPQDPLVLEQNNEQVINGLTAYGEKTTTFTTNEVRNCQYATAASAAAAAGTNINIDAITLVNLVSGATQVTAKVLSRTAASAAAAALSPFIDSALSEDFMNAAINQLPQNMGFNLYNNDSDDPLSKERSGVALAKYIENLYSKLGQRAGLSFGTREAIAAMAREQRSYNDEIARFERATRSPFDVSSEHTFLGSIFYKLVPLLPHLSSIGSGVGSFLGIVGSSFSSILPFASASSETNFAQSISSDEDCPLTASTGAAAGKFCTPRIAAYFSNIKDSAGDIALSISDNFEQENGQLKLDENKNFIIKPGSELMKYVVVCTTLDSMLGLPNANILADEAAAKKPSNAGWASGAECVTGKHPEFERYINDQEQLESMGMINKSASTVALEKYYEKNPLDTSYAGILARYSGMTKETVIALLDYTDYYNYIASYNPSDRLPVEKLILPTITDLIPETEIAAHSTKIGGALVSFVYNPVFLPLRDRAVASA